MKLLLWLVLSASHCLAQDTSGLHTYMIPDHTGGMYSFYSGQRLQKNQATDIINGFLDRDFAVVKRTGQQLYGNIPGCTSQVRGGASFKTSGGADYFFAVCDKNVYETTGDGTFSVHGATISSSNRVRFTQALGKEWVVDGVDPTWNTDGVTVSSPTQALAAALVGSFKSRILLANWAGNKSSVFLSGFANGNDYTIPAVIVDTSPVLFYLNGPNDGRGVTCVFDGYKDVVFLWNEDQMFGLYGNGYNTFVLRKLAEVGCTEQESVREFEGKLKWISKFGIYEYNGSNATRISDPVKDFLSNIIASDSSVQTLVQTLKADWDRGQVSAYGTGASMSTTLSPGNVTPSSVTFLDQISTDYGTFTSSSNISTSTVLNSVTLQPATFYVTNGDFGSGFTGWTKTGTWNAPAAFPSTDPYAACPGTGDTNIGAQPSCFAAGAGLKTFTIQYVNASGTIVKGCTATLLCGVNCQYSSDTCTSNTKAGTTNKFDLDVSTFAGLFNAKITGPDGDVITSPVGYGANFLSVELTGGGCNTGGALQSVSVSLCPNANYAKSGTVKSRIFDTTLSTPTFGPFTLTLSSSSEATATFQEEVSANGTVFDAPVTITPGQIPNVAQKRYQRLIASLTTSVSTKTATYASTALPATTSGYFITDCFNVGAISAWDLFQANTITNSGSITFAVSTGPTCNAATRSTNTWTSQSNNSNITIATASFMGVRAFLTPTSSTGMPYLQDITLNYRFGSGRPALASIIYDNRYWLAFSTNASGTAYNDTVLVYDKNGNWTKLKGINSASLWLYKRRLYSGSGLGDGNVVLQDVGDNDLGANIYFRFKTPDYDLETIAAKNLYDLTAEFLPTMNAPDGTTISVNYYADKSTTAFTLGNFPTYRATNGILYDTMRFGKLTDPVLVRTVSFEYINNDVHPVKLYRSVLRFMPLDFW